MNFIQSQSVDDFKIIGIMRQYFLTQIVIQQKLEDDEILAEPYSYSSFSQLQPDLDSMILNENEFRIQENREQLLQYPSLHFYQEVQSTKSHLTSQVSSDSSIQILSASEFL